ncbi:MAG: LacI family DNA-binding transcriptional regulator [Armatimonadota bacterium]
MAENTVSLNKATLKDVARAAGVAWSTASYALNGGPKPVSEAARRRVLDAAQSLGYSSNLLARGLVTGRMRTIGVLAPDFHSTNATEQIAGVEAEAQLHDYRVVLATHLSEPVRAEIMQRDMSARRMDGIISISATADVKPGVADVLPILGLPYIRTYHAPLDGLPGDYAAVNQEQGGYIATKHLLDQGRRRIVYVGPLNRRDAARKRLEGFRRAHAEAGRVLSEDQIVATETFYTSAGLEAGREILGRHPAQAVGCDAVLAASDTLAAGILRAAHETGLQVPGDLAVLGFDDITDLCDGLYPSLTSVHVPLSEIGRWSVRRLIERLDHPKDWEPTTRYFDCRITLRESA